MMQVEFDFPKLICELNLEQKRKFYVLFVHNLTVSNRAIWSDGNLSDFEKVEGMKWINEILHRLIFHIEDLLRAKDLSDVKLNDVEVWQTIEHWSSQNYEVVAGEVGRAIKFSYQNILEL